MNHAGQDGQYVVTEGVLLGDDDEDVPDFPEAHGGPHYLGIMHWGRQPLEAEACDALGDATDAIAIGFRNGSDAIVQIGFGRRGLPYSERDLAVLRMITPAPGRLVRERPTPSLPATLTVQERRILAQVAAGRTNQEIAERLFVAPSTVRKHLENAYRKLGVAGRVAAAARLQGRDLPELDLRERLLRLG